MRLNHFTVEISSDETRIFNEYYMNLNKTCNFICHRNLYRNNDQAQKIEVGDMWLILDI